MAKELPTTAKAQASLGIVVEPPVEGESDKQAEVQEEHKKELLERACEGSAKGRDENLCRTSKISYIEPHRSIWSRHGPAYARLQDELQVDDIKKFNVLDTIVSGCSRHYRR